MAVVLVPSEEDYDKRKEKKVKEGGRKITYDSMMKWKGTLIYTSDSTVSRHYVEKVELCPKQL